MPPAPPTRRRLLQWSALAALGAAATASCTGSSSSQAQAPAAPPPPLPGTPPGPAEAWRQQAAEALSSGASWLWSQQAADGSFPSRTVGLMGGGASLTGFCLDTLLQLPQAVVPVQTAAIGRALGALVDRTDEHGAIGLPAEAGSAAADYPVYATALALQAMARVRPPGWQEVAAEWRAWLLSQQLAGPEWAGHPAQGGFCFGYAEPRVPPEAGHVDLSMTRRAVEALRLSGTPVGDPALVAALAFVERCRARYGGFVYSPTDPSLNKGGCTEKRLTDGTAELACSGYGSATTDGILALRALDQDVAQDVIWLAGIHRLSENPGLEQGHTVFAEAMRGYYRAGAAAVFAGSAGAPRGWAEAMAAAVLAERQADGSWVNPSPLQKEHDPLVATAFALQALGRACTAPG